MNHERTWIEVSAERAFLKRLGGGCRLPIAAYGELKGDMIFLNGLVGTADGLAIIRNEFRGPVRDAQEIGIRLAEDLLSRGGKAIMDMITC